MSLEISDDAIFIADAHYGSYREALLKLLYDIDSAKITTSQLFLMGDIADLLFGGVDVTIELNRDFIELVESIAAKIDVIYLEGNHDFLLNTVFKNVMVFDRASQPVIFSYKDKKIALSHGDLFGGFAYEVYTKIIRHRLVVYFLNKINNIFSDFIIKKLLISMQNKRHCKKIENFKDIIKTKLSYLRLDGVDVLIEGHYHQDESFYVGNVKYINLAAFACNESYFRVQLSADKQICLKGVCHARSE